MFHGDFPEILYEENAAFVSLEDLAVAFAMPLEGTLFRTFYSDVNDFSIALLDRANSDLVIRTLRDCEQKLIHENYCVPRAIYFLNEPRLDTEELRHKMKFWDALAGKSKITPAPVCREVANQLSVWQEAWACSDNMDRWNAAKSRRLDICASVVDAATTLKMLAEAFRNHSVNQEAWLDLEANRLLGLYEANCKKRKERQGVAGDENQQSNAKIREIRAITAEKEKIEAERSKLKDEVEALKLSLETEKAATAAFQSKFEFDMACQICLNTPRNVVLLPCSHGQFCSPCIMEHRKTTNTWPTCRGKIQKMQPYL